jgi:Domain of unknown function (DUF4505)
VDHHNDDDKQSREQQHPNHPPFAKRRFRCYFYTIDLQGRLFLEETMPKNVATCIKDINFLNFFFHRLRPLSPDEQIMLEKAGIPIEDYPFVSPCRARGDYNNSSNSGNATTMMEYNLVRPAATPFVFHSILQRQQPLEQKENNNLVLVYAGDKKQPFDWTRLAISSLTGKLYHPIHATTNTSKEPDKQSSSSLSGTRRSKQESTVLTVDYNDEDENSSRSPSDENKQQQQQQPRQEAYALIRSNVAVFLSDSIVVLDDTTPRDCITNGNDDDGDENKSGMAIVLQKNHHQQHDGGGKTIIEQQHSSVMYHPIPWLPLEAEPGPWAMPHNEMND